MAMHSVIPPSYVRALGHAYFRRDDQIACAPLFASGGVDWACWTIVEECPVDNRQTFRCVLGWLGFDKVASERVVAGIAWY